MDEILAGDLPLAVAAVAMLVASWLLERRLSQTGPLAWYSLAFPTPEALVPLPTMPAGEGATKTVGWRVLDVEGAVCWWVLPDAPSVPQGVHGVAWLVPDTQGRVHLDVRWAPLWTPLLAVLWLAVIGTLRGDGTTAGPLAGMLTGALLYAYWIGSGPAVRALRLGLARSVEDEET